MRCPYLVKSHWQLHQNIFNRDNPEYLDSIVDGEGWTYEECVKSECAVWQNGSCQYNEK